MRHQIGFIALSLLAAAFAGCSSADTTSTTGASGNEPLTGALAKYNAAIVPLANPCSWSSAAATGISAGQLSVLLVGSDVAQISVRSVDKAILVNGQTCGDSVTGTANKGIATTTLVKKVVVGPATNADLTGAETVIIDTRNGQFALAGTGSTAASTGISIDLGTSGSDVVAIAGSTGADKFGCVKSGTNDTLGIKSATSKDVTFANATPSSTMKYIIDMSDGNDQFDQNDCTGILAVYGGLGNDVINVGSATSSNDTYSGGTDPSGTDKDVLSYALRTSTTSTAAMVINLSAVAVTKSLQAASTTPAAPFAMAAHSAGVLGGAGGNPEVDAVTDDFETITGSSADDFILSGAQTSTYTLNGGPGNDTFATQQGCPAIMNGNAGIDAANYTARKTKVTATLGSGADDGEATPTQDTDNIALDVENFFAPANADSDVTGSSANNVFFSGKGSDTFRGGTGDDTFMAAATTGTVTDGNDFFIGGDGTDTIDYSLRLPSAGYGVNITLDGAATSGLCVYTAASGTYVLGSEADTINNDVENAVGTSGTGTGDHIIGNSLPNVIIGLGGVDKLEGSTGDDQIDANTYSDGTHACNPFTLGCIGTTAICTCGALVSASTLGSGSAIDCGGDPLDVGTEKSGSGTITACSITQR